jgi:hypothetical protein
MSPGLFGEETTRREHFYCKKKRVRWILSEKQVVWVRKVRNHWDNDGKVKWNLSCNCHRMPRVEKMMRRMERRRLQPHKSIDRGAEEIRRHMSKSERAWKCFEIHSIGFERRVTRPLHYDRIRNQIEKKGDNCCQKSVVERESKSAMLIFASICRCHPLFPAITALMVHFHDFLGTGAQIDECHISDRTFVTCVSQ